MSHERIKKALYDAERDIRYNLKELNEKASGYRETLRYHQGEARRYKTTLTFLNKRKATLRREQKKIDSILYSINPIKNIKSAPRKDVGNE